MKVEPVTLVTEEPKPPTFSDREKRDALAAAINRRKLDYPSLLRSGRMTYDASHREFGALQALYAEIDARMRSSEPAETPQTEPVEVTGDQTAGGIGAPETVVTGDGSTHQDVSTSTVVDAKEEPAATETNTETATETPKEG